MSSNQRIAIRKRRVIEGGALPRIGTMAVGAGRGEAGSLVFPRVIGLVARDAVGLIESGKDQCERPFHVTTRTGNRRVASDQFEAARDGSVIERAVLPRLCVVALLTRGWILHPAVRPLIVALMA